jgi:hypothetical protein
MIKARKAQIEIAIICVQPRDSKIGQVRIGIALRDNYLQNNEGAKILKIVATIHRCKVESWHEAVIAMLALLCW